ncbi:MAG: hypothetical protein EOO04_19035 [Chitinophagaceae bacterium]|nr:MAG: hypothetical protein EOO04_19035 [Chitinophagaceae bacterium]
MKQTTVPPALHSYRSRKPQSIRGVHKINVHVNGDPDKTSFQQRIDVLREELTQLNLYDHPLRIVEICNEIQALRTEIRGERL